MKVKWAILAALLAAFATAAMADGLSTSVTPQIGGGIGGFNGGVSNLTNYTPPPPPSGCSAGQLDFSDSCNTTQYMVGL